MERGCDHADGIGRPINHSDQQKVTSRPRPKLNVGASLPRSTAPERFSRSFEDEFPLRSLTPPPDFASDPDEERRKLAKRLQPLHGVDANEDNPEPFEPCQQAGELSLLPGMRLEEEGSYVNVKQISSSHQWSQAMPITGKRTPLHSPSTRRALEQLLKNADHQTVNARDPAGQSPLHCFAKRGHVEYTTTLLCLGKFVNVDAQDNEGDTAMHIAVKDNRLMIINILLAFGASVTLQNWRKETPYDVAHTDTKSFLYQFVPEIDSKSIGAIDIFHNLDELVDSHTLMNARLDSLVHPQKIAAFVGCLDDQLNCANDLMISLDCFDEVVAIDKQRREIRRWKETNPLQVRPGIRVLFLDGGGIRGLILVMILTEMERVTGRKITELFDWIVGTSIGAILALSLIYGKSKSLQDIRSLFMRLKSRVFHGILSVDSSTKNLEQVLKEEFEEDVRLCDIPEPKVMVCVVNKKSANPTVEFFNNFMEDTPELTNVPVWHACRCTSAAPTYFHSCGDYVDGGVMANNPSMAAWAEIQRYYAKKQDAPPHISIAVSLGTGNYPDKNLGNIDIFGKNFFSLQKTVKRVMHLIEMLRNAIGQSEETSRRFSALCNDRQIPFFRFNPDLFEIVATGETNDKKLVNMLLQTRLYLQQASTLEEMARMVTLLKHLSLLHRARAKPQR